MSQTGVMSTPAPQMTSSAASSFDMDPPPQGNRCEEFVPEWAACEVASARSRRRGRVESHERRDGALDMRLRLDAVRDRKPAQRAHLQVAEQHVEEIDCGSFGVVDAERAAPRLAGEIAPHDAS